MGYSSIEGRSSNIVVIRASGELMLVRPGDAVLESDTVVALDKTLPSQSSYVFFDGVVCAPSELPELCKVGGGGDGSSDSSQLSSLAVGEFVVTESVAKADDAQFIFKPQNGSDSILPQSLLESGVSLSVAQSQIIPVGAIDDFVSTIDDTLLAIDILANNKLGGVTIGISIADDLNSVIVLDGVGISAFGVDKLADNSSVLVDN